jgi:hypothetical protein
MIKLGCETMGNHRFTALLFAKAKLWQPYSALFERSEEKGRPLAVENQ